MLCEGFNKRHYASLGIEPCISAELLLEWFQTLHDSAHAETVIAFGAIQGTNDQVDDAKMEHLSLRLFDGHSVFLFLHTFHEFFGICVLGDHNI